MHNQIIKAGTSEVILPQGIDNSALQTPNIGHLNISNSSEVHVGPELISITQNVNNEELIKGKFLGLELISSRYPKRLRCSVGVFVCWSLLVTVVLIAYIVYLTKASQTILDTGINASWYLRRADWQAMPAYSLDFLQLPLSYVIIGHSGANYCTDKYSCMEQMLEIQQDHLRRDYGDIGPNFLVGANGYIFEGRGPNVVAAMVIKWNVKSIMIMFIGNYAIQFPEQEQIDHVNILLETLVNIEVLHPNYMTYGQCQILPWTVPPGRNIMNKMNDFSHWNSTNKNECL